MIKTIPKKRNAKWLSEEALQIAMKRREAKGKGEKERYSHLMGRTNSLEKTLLLGMIEGKKEIGVAEDEMVR